MMLNKLASGIASGTPGSSALQLVLHQQDGMMHSLFALDYDATTSTWGMAVQLDEQTATTSIIAAPSFATNTTGNIFVAWL